MTLILRGLRASKEVGAVHNDFVTAADGAAQVVLVGDSGQIGPVATFRTETQRGVVTELSDLQRCGAS